MDVAARQVYGNRALSCTVFLTGAAVLVVEILGPRFLAPYYGANVFAWSSLITVTLMALAAGYLVGGRLADLVGSDPLLDQVIALAAILIVAAPALVRVTADPVGAFGYQAGVFLTALVGFGPGLCALGMVCPIAIRLSAADIDHVGRSAGSIYAWSTAGSILGALSAGFVLLPLLAVSRALHLLGVGLLALAAMRWLARSRRTRGARVGVALVICLSVAVGAQHEAAKTEIDGFRLIERRLSYYGTVQVVEDTHYRYLLVDGMGQNAQTLGGRWPAMHYVHVLGTLPYLRPGGSRMLLIGLGAGDLVRVMAEHGVRTTAVEIVPAVADAAFARFGLDPGSADVVVGDGRRFLNHDTALYDFVVLDAFAGGCPPSHLYSREAFERIRARLTPGGVAGVNIVVDSLDHALVDAIAATLGSVFDNLLAVYAEERADELNNVVFFASGRPLRFPAEWTPAPADPRTASILASLSSRLLDLDRRAGIVLTDDFNPIDTLSASTERKLREQTRRALPAEILAP